MPKVSILIVSFNNENDLPGLIESLKCLDYPELEILFADNASSDRSVEIIKSSGYRLLANTQNLWFAGGNNQLQREASGSDYLFLLNPDTEIDPLCLRHLIDLMEQDQSIGIVQPLIMRLENKDTINTKGNNLHFCGFGYVGGDGEKSWPDKPSEIGYASGAALCLRANVVEGKIFREHFKAYHEDLDLSWRVRLKGYKIILCPDAKVYHKYSFKKGGYKWFLMELNRLKVLFTNYSALSLLLLLPYLVFVECVVLARSVQEGWFLLKAKSYLAFILILPKLVFERLRIQRERRVGDESVILTMTGSLIIPMEPVSTPLRLFNKLSELYFTVFKSALSFLSRKFEPQKISKAEEA